MGDAGFTGVEGVGVDVQVQPPESPGRRTVTPASNRRRTNPPNSAQRSNAASGTHATNGRTKRATGGGSPSARSKKRNPSTPNRARNQSQVPSPTQSEQDELVELQKIAAAAEEEQKKVKQLEDRLLGGTGGDSDDDESLAELHDEGRREAVAERGGWSVEDQEQLLNDAETLEDLLNATAKGSEIPIHVTLPEPPPTWEPKKRQTDLGEPPFDEVDNPGGWPQYVLRAILAAASAVVAKVTGKKKSPAKKGDKKKAETKKKVYSHHETISKCRVVPPNDEDDPNSARTWDPKEGEDEGEDGKGKDEDAGDGGDCGDGDDANKRSIWQLLVNFLYGGEYQSGKNFRSGATKANMFPNERKGALDMRKLKAFGLDKYTMQEQDWLFILQLLLPLCDPTKSGVPGDPRIAFFELVLKWTNIYIAKHASSYQHEVKPFVLDEIVRCFGIILMDGVLGGCGGNFHVRWEQGNPNMCQDIINSGITYTRFLEFKNNVKLCDNDEAKKSYEDGYEPAFKFDYFLKALVHNTNIITLIACLDQCGDETSFGFGGCGPIIFRITGKPGISKGGQIVLLVDVDRKRVRAYVHRHRLHDKPEGWGAMGEFEVKMLVDKLEEQGLVDPQHIVLVGDSDEDGDYQDDTDNPSDDDKLENEDVEVQPPTPAEAALAAAIEERKQDAEQKDRERRRLILQTATNGGTASATTTTNTATTTTTATTTDPSSESAAETNGERHQPQRLSVEEQRKLAEKEHKRRIVLENLLKKKQADDRTRKLFEDKHPIFKELPHITGDNYFTGSSILRYLGEKGYAYTGTLAKKRTVWKNIPSHFFHKEKPKSKDQRTKVMRFMNPVFAYQNVPAKDGKKAYTLQHSSFMSTSSCNIAHVNGVNCCNLSISIKTKGQGIHRHDRPIEMNQSRETYLKTYFPVDKIDQMIKLCCMFILSRKYWHAAMVHLFGLVIVCAYDIYLEICEGKGIAECKMDKPVSFLQFRTRLATQMLYYSDKNKMYKGDDKKRVNTQLPKKQRKRKRDYKNSVTQEQYDHAKDVEKRLCGDLTEYERHARQYETVTHGRVCVVCKEEANNFCKICKKFMHKKSNRGANGHKTCDIKYHNDMFFGLARDDHKELMCRPVGQWKPPTEADVAENVKLVTQFKKARME